MGWYAIKPYLPFNSAKTLRKFYRRKKMREISKIIDSNTISTSNQRYTKTTPTNRYTHTQTHTHTHFDVQTLNRNAEFSRATNEPI